MARAARKACRFSIKIALAEKAHPGGTKGVDMAKRHSDETLPDEFKRQLRGSGRE